jgi:hypothetical protein
MKVWSKYNAMIKLSQNVDMDLVEEALELWEQREKFKRSVVLAKERVLPQIEGRSACRALAHCVKRRRSFIPLRRCISLGCWET